MKFDLQSELQMSETFLQRFWDKVKVAGADECWEWQAGRHYKGYGEFGKLHVMNGARGPKSHKISYLIAHGEVPDGMLVCHKCDNPPCVNPAHLFLGTDGDNTRDSVSKGRFVSTKRGEGHKSSILTDAIVLDMRAMFAGGSTIKSIAEKHCVTSTHVCCVVYRKTWKHLS